MIKVRIFSFKISVYDSTIIDKYGLIEDIDKQICQQSKIRVLLSMWAKLTTDFYDANSTPETCLSPFRVLMFDAFFFVTSHQTRNEWSYHIAARTNIFIADNNRSHTHYRL